MVGRRQAATHSLRQPTNYRHHAQEPGEGGGEGGGGGVKVERHVEPRSQRTAHPRTRAALVQYTDLEEKWHCLWEEKFEWLDEQPSAVRAAELRGVRVK